MNLEELFRMEATDDEEYILALANELDLNKDLLIFLAKESTRPSVEVYAQKYNGIVDEKLWLRGYCPICGSKPKMAELQGEEGRRTLLCSFCGNVWFYKRLKCPICESGDPEALKYFYIEGEETACRIDICERCRGYIKTVDSRKISGEVVPFIEDLGSLHLDIIAIKEGYTKVSGNMLGIK
ncbi:MAG: formate dehydrogenase accessory protein FdhE [candidate division NC10 bacterium]|nr:formate dehydrogenase accessory protein FdhE [candidate division NC10 bacterium]